MRKAVKHLLICCALLAMLWAQVFGLQHHLFVCLCSDEPVETIVDHCHDETGHQPTLAAEHHADHNCDHQSGKTQHHSPLKEELKARTAIGQHAAPQPPMLFVLFTLPDLLIPKISCDVTGMTAMTPCGHLPGPPLSVQVHQSVVFLI